MAKKTRLIKYADCDHLWRISWHHGGKDSSALFTACGISEVLKLFALSYDLDRNGWQKNGSNGPSLGHIRSIVREDETVTYNNTIEGD